MNGVSVKANSLTLNGGTITDSVGNALNLNHRGIANAGDAQMVGTTVSDIRSLAFTSTGPYAVDDTITVTVEATEQVTVTGIPRIPMTLGACYKVCQLCQWIRDNIVSLSIQSCYRR